MRWTRHWWIINQKIYSYLQFIFSVSSKACRRDVLFSITMTLLPKLLHKCVRAEKLIFSGKVIGPTFVVLHSDGNFIWTSLTLFNSHCVFVQVATFPTWSGNLKIIKINYLDTAHSYFNHFQRNPKETLTFILKKFLPHSTNTMKCKTWCSKTSVLNN